MGSQSKQQSYPYSLRTVLASNQSMCGSRWLMYMLPPKGALTIERLFCHFVIQFDTSVPSAYRMIETIGIVDEVPIFDTGEANRQKRIELNQQADANRRVDISIDLTHLLNPTDVSYEETGFDDGGDDTNFTMVEVTMPYVPNYESYYLTTGTVELWKIDGLFTTIGIR